MALSKRPQAAYRKNARAGRAEGGGGRREARVRPWFAAAAPVFEKHGKELWSVVELFHREPKLDLTSTKSWERLREQMAKAAPYVKRSACWEYQNFLSPESPLPGAKELSRQYRAHFGL